MTANTADCYGILGLTSDATLADVKKAYRKLARQHHPDRNNADPGAIDRFRRITEAYEYLSAHLKDNAHGNGHSRPGPTAPPRADVGMPVGYSEAASRVLTRLEETWQAIRAPPPRDPARRHHHGQRHHRPGRQMGPLRLPAVDRPHHRHPDKDPSHSDHPSHTSSRVVRRGSTSAMADAAP
jgi:DnaJ domain